MPVSPTNQIFAWDITYWREALQLLEIRPGPDDAEILPDLVIHAYKPAVDRTLIVEQLRRSVDDRVKTMTAASRFAEALHEAGRRRRET